MVALAQSLKERQMNDKQKAWGIGAAIIVIAALFFLFRGGSTSAAVVQNVPGTTQAPGGVTVQNVTFNRDPFVIPTLNAGERWQGLSAIGACCADCSGATPRQSYTPAGSRGPTIIFNEGDRGANVFNYFTPAPAPVAQKPTWRNQVTMRIGR